MIYSFALALLATIASVALAAATTDTKYKITVKNLAFQQPFSSFFVMVHNDRARPLYIIGEPARTALARLAEDGDPNPLIDAYKHTRGVYSLDSVPGPLFVDDEPLVFYVNANDDFDMLTIATMAINTNDCFCSLNGVKLYDGAVFNQPGLDAGSEENNELCSSIPGPACPSDSGNVKSRNGEGVVHIHRGFHGINMGMDLGKNDVGVSGRPLSAVGYDWRNPMMRVYIEKAD